jgi:hypothetical protein
MGLYEVKVVRPIVQTWLVQAASQGDAMDRWGEGICGDDEPMASEDELKRAGMDEDAFVASAVLVTTKRVEQTS